MPGLSGPSDYSQEPSRHPCLHINAKEPFNAEPPRSALVSSYVTPVELFFKRNHGPIPLVDDIERYCVDINGLIESPKKLYFRDIRMLPKYNVTATLQCAGNRRTAMSITRKVKGVGWNVSAIGNAVWGGAKLADILELIGVPKLTSSTQSGGKHIEFVSIDKCEEENGGPYKASIPLSQATNPEADVLLAYEMNGESVICSLEDAQSIKPGKVRISGYAVSGGCRGIERVDVSIDGGKTWREATRFQKTGIPYIADGISNDKWAWVLFELTVDIPQSTEIIAKAVDSAANVQPEKVQDIWNLRGILNTSWHRVHVRIGHSNM
uniref:Sulfite oxidase n=1 Tax=Gossypium raimondii TaxID=29730 RepID=A0A0D2QWL2_GOSRA|nr:hypothetical protein B456_001G270800 [Gossypium raimondii]